MQSPKRLTAALQKGFTLIELLVVIGIIGILAAVVLIAVNPGRQFASARDTQRRADLYSITSAIYQYATENNGNLPDNNGAAPGGDPLITSTPTVIGTDPGLVNLANTGGATPEPILVPTYIAAIPYDPSTGTEGRTNYTISLDANGRVVATASSELNPGTTISVTR